MTARKEEERFDLILMDGEMHKRSATECAAVLDICRELQIVELSPLVEGRDILFKIVSMLIKLIRSFEVG